MKRYTILAAGAIFVSTLIAGLAIYWRYGYYAVWLSSTSPNQNYTVEMTGDKGRGGLLIPSKVKYNILIRGERITSDRLIHSGDAMDISFELAYPKHAWINENTLHFWSDRHRRQDKLDTLLISNTSDKVISYLRIKTWDLFFVFDVQPRSQLKLFFTHLSEGKLISAEGMFEDGSTLDYAVGFLENGRNAPLGYCMTIDHNRVVINSPREKAYDYQGNWDKLNIDMDSRCQP